MKTQPIKKFLWLCLAGVGLTPSIALAQFIYPVSGYVPTNGHYGACRDDCTREHKGLDISGSTGTAVGAGYAGTASFVGTSCGLSCGYGKLVILDHPSSYQTYYAHLDAYAISKGTSVTQNQVIAYRGNTGGSTGPHVHYEIRRYGSQLYIPGDEGETITRNTPVPENYPGLEPVRDDRLDIVVRGDSNRIYWRSFWRNNGGWGSWTSLGGAAQEKPGISSRGPGQLEVFIRGGGNDINWRYLASGSWSGWGSLGGPLASGISAVSRSSDRINLVARGTNNEVQHKWWTPSGWSAFQSLGGWTAHTPSISARDSNHLDVFIRGGGGDLNWRAWSASNGWAGWGGLGGNLASGPSAVSRSSDRINVVARSTDNSIIHKFWTPNGWASNWENLGGATVHEPGIGSWGSGRLDVVITGGGKDINQRFWTSSGGWSGWGSLGTTGNGFTAGPEAVGGQW